jgi:hypothetical protein
MGKTVFDTLIDKFVNEIELKKDSLSRGSMKSYEEYKEACGFIRGLETARSHVTDLSRNFEEFEDD